MILSLPKDPYMLLSYTNTQLRNKYKNLEDFCKSLNIKQEELKNILKKIDYQYNEITNQFV